MLKKYMFFFILSLSYAHLPSATNLLEFTSNDLNIGHYRGCSTSGCSYEGHIKYPSFSICRKYTIFGRFSIFLLNGTFFAP